MSLDLDDPSAREAALGPAGAAYQHKGVTVGTDGACKSDGAMGAAFVSKNRRLQAKSVAVHGSPSSSRQELTAIGLACEDSPKDEDLTIITDSLSSMSLLKSIPRKDFPQPACEAAWPWRSRSHTFPAETRRAHQSCARPKTTTSQIKTEEETQRREANNTKKKTRSTKKSKRERARSLLFSSYLMLFRYAQRGPCSM